MKPMLMTLSLLALVAVLLQPILFFVDAITLAQTQHYLIAATIVWFVVTPLWMGRSGTRQEPQGSAVD